MMTTSVPPRSLQAALAYVKAGGALVVTTYTHQTVITQKTIDRFTKAHQWLLQEDGDGYRLRQGKGSDYLFPGQLKFECGDLEEMGSAGGADTAYHGCGTDDDPCVLCILCDEEPVDGETEMCSVCRSRGANV